MPASASMDVSLGEELERLIERARRLVPRPLGKAAQLVTPRSGLHVLRQEVPTQFEAAIYDPMLCLILQGRKEMAFAERTYRLGAGQCALVSHDLPIVSRVREAPYLVVLLEVELEVLRGLQADVGELASRDEAEALEVHRADARLLDAMGRYLALTEEDGEARVLAPLLLKELHYRLLTSPLGGMLRSLLRRDSHASSIARAIALLRRDFRAPMVVEELARAVGMSVSAFHQHFKAVTASSPLQYQKELRLLEARRRLCAGATSVAAAGFEVGYESASQFSREYARKFGHPPSHDVTERGDAAARRPRRRG